MPYFPNTPEKLLRRNDSKNPASTCQGITSNGRPCRRALASPRFSPAARRHAGALNGLIALVHEDGAIQAADFYCWQHKDQARQRVEDEKRNAKGGKRRSTELFPLQEKSSIDTMVQRLGLDAEGEKKADKTRNPRPPRMTQSNDFATNVAPQRPHVPQYHHEAQLKHSSNPKSRGFWASLCCMTAGDDDYVEIVRHKKRTGRAYPPDMAASKPASVSRPQSTSVTGPKGSTSLPVRPGSPYRRFSNAQTNDLLSLIPQHLSPQKTAALLAELIKPISPTDEEGYIYIFWLTPQSKSQPTESTARSLLAPSSARPKHERRISDVMTEFSFAGNEETARGGLDSSGKGKKTVMLKIGRASNITRRMNEWSRQCGYQLNLVRWYPHVPSNGGSDPTSPARTPQSRRCSSQPLYPDLSRPPSHIPAASRRQSDVVRKVPCVKRVERLTHLELAEQRVMQKCAACTKEHREWFEVEASQAGVKAVDETIRRWIGWAETLEG